MTYRNCRTKYKNYFGLVKYDINGKIFIFMGEGQHKIKRKAEQIACNEALTFLKIDDVSLPTEE